MSHVVHLLGRPHVEGRPGGYQVRSRKSWALLAYLVLSDRPPTRSQLASLLFDGADDPLAALRWGLAEVRRVLGDGAVVEGDPVLLRLPPGTLVDVTTVLSGSWSDAVRLPGLGSELLEGHPWRGAATFESWLLSEQRRVMAASEEILHEAALAAMSVGSLDEAIAYAVRLVAMTPLEENHHALLIRLYRLSGDDTAAEQQLATCTGLLERELGVRPGPVVRAALRETRRDPDLPPDRPSVEAVLEAGRAAVSAGAIETGADSLRTAVRGADNVDDPRLQVSSRLVLAEALVHSLGGLDEEGMAALQGADDIALAHGDRASVAEARSELGYVDFLRGRYDRALVWLSQALEYADGAEAITAKATTYIGSVESDRARYPEALAHLEESARLASSVGDLRRGAYATSMIGRVHLLRGELDLAAQRLDESLDLVEQDHWLFFAPWPQALRGEVELLRGDEQAATSLLQQSFARACQLGDPCWEGLSARGLALAAAAAGDASRAFDVLADARSRANRRSDPYVWLDGYILDALCTLGREHGHSGTPAWVEDLQELAARHGMRELVVRSLLHGAALGRPGDAEAAVLLAADIVNPEIDRLVGAAAAT
jgi:DNA-binding SARP family transcriptional activator